MAINGFISDYDAALGLARRDVLKALVDSGMTLVGPEIYSDIERAALELYRTKSVKYTTDGRRFAREWNRLERLERSLSEANEL